MKYTQAYNGDWIRPQRRGYRIRCCDCGLVHVLNFRVRDGKVEYQVHRDNRATAAFRKRRRP